MDLIPGDRLSQDFLAEVLAQMYQQYLDEEETDQEIGIPVLSEEEMPQEVIASPRPFVL